MTKSFITVFACISLVLPVGVAAAQNSGASSAPSAEHMQGSPNANGYGKGEGLEKVSPMDGATGVERNGKEGSSATDMKGPPNANGYSK
jgi:hypothetical protein